MRADHIRPGEWKERRNRLGDTFFVDPELVLSAAAFNHWLDCSGVPQLEAALEAANALKRPTQGKLMVPRVMPQPDANC